MTSPPFWPPSRPSFRERPPYASSGRAKNEKWLSLAPGGSQQASGQRNANKNIGGKPKAQVEAAAPSREDRDGHAKDAAAPANSPQKKETTPLALYSCTKRLGSLPLRIAMTPLFALVLLVAGDPTTEPAGTPDWSEDPP